MARRLPHRINHQLKPGRDCLLSVAFLMLTVPDGEPDRLETTRLQPGIVDGVWTPEITSHDDTPDTPVPQRDFFSNVCGAHVEPHGLTAVAPIKTSTEPAESYPPSPRLRRAPASNSSTA